MTYILFNVYLFCLGAVFGSFFNVVIWRFDKSDKSLLTRSECPKCGKSIRWFENIPIFSFVFLRGKCSGCKGKISFQYPLIEFVSGMAMLLLWDGQFSPTSFYFLAFHFFIFGCFLCHLVIDLMHYILPNVINILLGLAFLGFSAFNRTWDFWLIGSLVGFGFPGLITYLFYKFRGKIGLGMGDIKLFGVLGLYLGAKGIVFNIFISCFLGAIVGLIAILVSDKTKDSPIPFGPSIVVVSSIQIFYPSLFENLTKLIAF